MKNEYRYYYGFFGRKKRVGPMSWEKMQQWQRIVKLNWRGVR